MTKEPTWRKSSYSGGTGNSECVELLISTDQVGIRDSKAPEYGRLSIPAPAHRALLDTLRSHTPGA
ncbi:DUF397 domain-containing protein [Amycolatopsis samaneae]|uniref:DUF397 domain-containing protein n=1 Tax=Amycolatopsis samaneae TaxID=664691 RepID=A0ABW5G8K5_9PSEU